MKYLTKVLEYSPKADTMAKRVEEAANEMAEEGYELVSFSSTEAAKAILVFRKRENNLSH
ncbi:MAG: hypothetical protein IJX63_16185 [Lachnospiraceae bacterium]|nr:hypothetical protein [Lachnospiraceae bacterium]